MFLIPCTVVIHVSSALIRWKTCHIRVVQHFHNVKWIRKSDRDLEYAFENPAHRAVFFTTPPPLPCLNDGNPSIPVTTIVITTSARRTITTVVVVARNSRSRSSNADVDGRVFAASTRKSPRRRSGPSVGSSCARRPRVMAARTRRNIIEPFVGTENGRRPQTSDDDGTRRAVGPHDRDAVVFGQ